ncbi:Cysteine-rich protein 2 [Labeo rohita]|uniref:Cysteine-rich protein 2 n=1 Tax=Labeo rohita TaxID=84645 RepID=A0ABQ8LV48_LABRO|nr:Cysteine-rich protein 2 [Labeo rohita]
MCKLTFLLEIVKSIILSVSNPPAEKVSSLGKDWHKFCLKCERCSKTLTAGGHAEHDGKPYCHKPCYAALFGPKGVNIGGAGSYVYEAPANSSPPASIVDSAPKPQEKRVPAPSRPPSKAEKVTSLGKDWHRPCLRCERCKKTLAAGSHAEHDGQPYCHKPCYAVLFGPKGVNTGGVGSYIYDKEPNTEAQP